MIFAVLTSVFYLCFASPLRAALSIPLTNFVIIPELASSAILLLALWRPGSASLHAPSVPKLLLAVGAIPWEFITPWLLPLRLLNLPYLTLLPPLTHRLDRYTPWMRTTRRLLLSLLGILLLAHWVACGWIALGGVQEFPGLANTYTAALYWSITTMATVGYGDIVAHTLLERWYAMGVMLLGIGFFGYIVGNVASILASVDRMGTQHRERMEQIRTYMRFHQFPAPLRQRIEDYFNYIFEQRLGNDDETFIKDLPNSLRAEVALFRHQAVLRKVPFLQDAAPKTIERLAFRLRPQLLRDGDLVFRQGDRGDRMYFVNKGSVEVLARDDHSVLARLQEGSFFGEMALLNQEPRNATIRATGFCELVYLDHAALEEAMKRFPDFAAEIHRIARQRAQGHPIDD